MATGFDFRDQLGIFNYLLEGHRPTPDILDWIVEKHLGEDEHLEFKHRDFLNVSERNGKPRNPGRDLRIEVSAFANAEGGVLIIGIDEFRDEDQTPRRRGQAKEVEGIEGDSTTELEARIANFLEPMKGQLQPFPRIKVVEHPKGLVAAITVQRSYTMVALTALTNHPPVYYIRVGHSAVPCPPWLLSDLVLGRRQHPTFSVGVRLAPTEGDTIWRSPHLLTYLTLTIENISLVYAKGLTIGVVAPENRSKNPLKTEYSDLPASVRTAIDVQEATTDNHPHFAVPHLSKGYPETLPPFRVCEYRFDFTFKGPESIRYITSFPMYVMADGHPPSWHELHTAICIYDRDEAEVATASIEPVSGTPAYFVRYEPLRRR